MSYWLHPLAEQELAAAAHYYAEHASNRIAREFLNEFEAVAMLLQLLQDNQQIGARTTQGLRIVPLRRFPYSVIYREAGNGPRIFAVSHQKREPDHWASRL